MKLLLLLAILISFVLTAVLLPRWIRKCHKINFLWEDMNKYKNKKNVAASGGVVVVMAFVLAALGYVAVRTFVFQSYEISLEIFSLLSMILILSVVGFVDDILGWRHGGLSKQFRIFLAFAASIPLVVINAGTHQVSIPLIGNVNLGIIYPLIIIPIGVAGATTTYNFLAGFNGLEAGQGIIILSFLSLIAYATGSPWLAVIGLCMVAGLVVFYFYNKYPARVFPGDILTYAIGALIAGMAILGNFEKIAVFVFIPYIIETLLKIRGKLPQSFGKPKKDGSLELLYGKVYGLTHFSIWFLSKFKRKVYERDVVYLIHIFQLIICLSALIIFRNSIF
jgi:UDP-N-acetylglucosamine--dolichyl-phosphate N-acetylglucosaminephosphotransferase